MNLVPFIDLLSCCISFRAADSVPYLELVRTMDVALGEKWSSLAVGGQGDRKADETGAGDQRRGSRSSAIASARSRALTFSGDSDPTYPDNFCLNIKARK